MYQGMSTNSAVLLAADFWMAVLKEHTRASSPEKMVLMEKARMIIGYLHF